jgi:pimeloyl-ACP methyl ester carboxylesterase
LALACLAALGGCASPQFAKLRSAPKNPLVDQLKLSTKMKASVRTEQILREYDLVDELDGEPHKLLRDLQQVIEREPSADKLYSFAELSYRAGKKVEATDQKAALDFYGAAVTYSYLYLFDQRFSQLRNPYDPEFRGACDLYNGALEGALRIVKKQGALLPGRTHSIETATQSFDVTVQFCGRQCRGDECERFEFASDYEIQGLVNQYQSYGLGVPLVAVHKTVDKQAPTSKYYPPILSFPVTAFLRVLPDDEGCVLRPGARHKAVLELHDPLSSTDIVVGDRRVPLESDLSTPLAYELNDPFLNRLANYGATKGLLRPDNPEAPTGLYMLQPYEPGKIPVVMVHGLWSSPLTWTEMFNDLRSQPEISHNYQFWFYLYPTGQPFWNSATQMRSDLAEVRQRLDPQHRDSAFDQMVLVGHSMGGLVSRLQALESHDDFWHIVSDAPFNIVRASYEVREHMQQLFFFHANPSIRRVVTIATPHRGSDFANETTRWLAQKIISVPQTMSREEIVRDNPGVFRDQSLVKVKTSLDSLALDSPILPVMLRAERAPWIKYHNIVGVLPDKGVLGSTSAHGDGVVPYTSAHLDDVASEIVVPADHSNVHRHPRSVLEVRRILLEHLHELRTFPNVPRAAGPVIYAGATAAPVYR